MKNFEIGATWATALAAGGAVLVLAALTIAACAAAVTGFPCW